MLKSVGFVWKFVREYWERLLFGTVGLSCLAFSFKFLYNENISAASAVFAIAFFSFLYSNISRFKRFKGLGFEAELWEDKQKEAADLIERLKSVVSIYTREIVLNNVLRGRWGGGEDWKTRWSLYDELVNQHDALGQNIDFTGLKSKIDGIFLFDICQPLSSSILRSIETARRKAHEMISIEFGRPITDAQGHSEKLQKLNGIKFSVDDMFQRSEHENIAQEILDKARAADDLLEARFSIRADFDQSVIQKLEKVSKLYDKRPLQIDDDIVALAKP